MELRKLFMEQKRLLAEYERQKQISAKFRNTPLPYIEQDKETIERELWLNATCQVLLQVGKPVPQAGISQAVLAQGIIPSDMSVSLSDAVQKELNRKSKSRIRGVPGQPGVICLADSEVGNRGSKAKKEKSATEWREKYRELRAFVKKMIFVNSAYCDQVCKVEEKIARAKNVRRCLVKKLLTCMVEHSGANGKVSNAALEKLIAVSKNSSAGRRIPAPRKKRTIRETLEKPKLLVQPLPVDSNGKPVFPIVLQELTVHSLGVIPPIEKLPLFNDSNLSQGLQACTYLCRIEDDGGKPKFIITIDDERFTHKFASNSIDQVHSLLLQGINQSLTKQTLPNEPNGAAFFGLDNPNVMSLIQCLSGAKKCSKYDWKKFTVSKREGVQWTESNKPSVSFTAALRYLSTP
ncbi:DgyrCDS770 [Dimorphilus gyrociliatus]|uniref:DgyrCDS770 n=1 Tax=Dimorphilus gyrociliatus TaxID=2664684 RepID=A0A7I8V5B9_9ANNE|nr:DgyrCDS770 [Dimorphilus gyrociliatus]